MSSPFEIVEGGPWRGIDGRDKFDIDPGFSPDLRNRRPLAGDSGAMTTRRGHRALIFEDRLAAEPWPAAAAWDDGFYLAGAYATSDGDTYRALVDHHSVEHPEDDLGTLWEIVHFEEGDFVQVGGGTFECITAHDASDSFATDLAAGNWRAHGSIGVHAAPSPSGEGVLVQAIDSEGRTVLAGHFQPTPLLSLPPGFTAPAITPDTPIPPSDDLPPIYAYLGGWSDSAGVACRLFKIDINPLSEPIATARLITAVTLTAGTTHRIWGMMGPDGACRFLAWRSEEGLAETPSSIWTYLGKWDGSTLEEMAWVPKFGDEDVASDGTHENDFDTVDVLRMDALLSSGERATIGDHTGNADIEPAPPPESRHLKDITWVLPAAPLPPYLFASDGHRATLLKWSGQEDSGYPHAFGLTGKRVLLSTTSSADTDEGINVRRVSFAQVPPAVETSSSQTYATSEQPATGYNAFWPNKVAPITSDLYAVAQGTHGASIGNLNAGQQGASAPVPLAFGAAVPNALGVIGNRRMGMVLVANAESGVGLVIREFGLDGSATGRAWGQTQFTNLGKAYRGMFLDPSQQFLAVLTYNSAASAGARCVVSVIDLLSHAWATATEYVRGNLVHQGTNWKVYRAIKDHNSGDYVSFAAALADSAWVEEPTVLTLDLSSHTDVEANVWAWADSAGAIHRNVALEG